jgi:hypothetical protein
MHLLAKLFPSCTAPALTKSVRKIISFFLLGFKHNRDVAVGNQLLEKLELCEDDSPKCAFAKKSLDLSQPRYVCILNMK